MRFWKLGFTVSSLVILVGLLTAWRLQDAPIYLTPDEVVIALDAHAIATTASDLRGRFLPLYFQISEFQVNGTIWYQPLIMYATAFFLTFLPLSESVVRFPAVCVGVADVVLIYFLARALFKSEMLAVFAALGLAFTPAHFIHSRFAMDYLFPVPFILAWLLGLTLYDERNDPRFLIGATASLGVGFYSYIGAVLLMPIYFALTVSLLLVRRAPRRHHLAAIIGFGLPLLFFIGWLIQHPSIYTDTLARYELGNANRLGVTERVSMYWQYFSPSFLFFNGGSQLVFSTRQAGVFLLPLAVFLAFGIHRAIAAGSPMARIALAGFATAPFAALLLDEGSAINRELEVLPFAIVLCTYGLRQLWSAKVGLPIRSFYLPLSAAALGLGLSWAAWSAATQSRVPVSALLVAFGGAGLYLLGVACERSQRWRPLVVGLMLLASVQFAYFYTDYFTGYRERSTLVFQRNIRGALEAILALQSPDGAPVYLSNDIRWIDSVLEVLPDQTPAGRFARADRAVRGIGPANGSRPEPRAGEVRRSTSRQDRGGVGELRRAQADQADRRARRCGFVCRPPAVSDHIPGCICSCFRF